MSVERLTAHEDGDGDWSEPLLTPAIDPDAVAWSEIASATYRIDQLFRYVYPGPIRNLRHRLVLTPPLRHGAQERVARSLTLSPDLVPIREYDAFGNEIVRLSVPRVERSLEVTFAALVRTYAGDSAHEFDLGDGCAPVGDLDHSLALHTPSGLTECDDAMREIAFELQQQYRDERERARAIVRFAFERIAYTKNVTDVTTTAIQAFHLRRGVCQDVAHVALALGRSAGLACRYVMGHLLGEGGTHAWVEFLVASPRGRTRVLALDPTHDRDVTMRYVVVAVGRDYEDVAPTSGSFDAPYAGTFTARHAVTIARIVYR